MKILLTMLLTALVLNTACAQEHPLTKLDINLDNYTYPYPVAFFEVHNQQQDLQMAYMDVQPAHYNGHNVLLLHGKNFNGAYWGQTIASLTKAGFRVVVPDQIGFGKSTKPKTYQYSFQQLASNTKQLLDRLGIHKTAVLGHSMGGMVATRFALMYPEVTEKLILENPIGLEDWKRKVPYKPVNWWYEKELKSNYQSIKKYQMDSYYDGKWNADFDEWARLLAGWTLNADYPLIAWNAALTYDMIFTQPVCYEFDQVTSPTLLIIGTRDRTALGKPLVSPEVAQTMGDYKTLGKRTAAAIPHATLVELAHIGHLPHVEAFDRFIKPLIAFLQQ